MSQIAALLYLKFLRLPKLSTLFDVTPNYHPVLIRASALFLPIWAGEARGRRRLIGCTKGGMNSKLHAVTDAAGRPLRMFLTAGQRSDYIGAQALLDGLPPADYMLADRGYDADWYREALEDGGITPCIPSRKNRKVPIPYDEARYRKRHKIENSFARLKNWRRVATRYDRCPKVFLSACALAAGVMFWLWVLTLTLCQPEP